MEAAQRDSILALNAFPDVAHPHPNPNPNLRGEAREDQDRVARRLRVLCRSRAACHNSCADGQDARPNGRTGAGSAVVDALVDALVEALVEADVAVKPPRKPMGSRGERPNGVDLVRA